MNENKSKVSAITENFIRYGKQLRALNKAIRRKNKLIKRLRNQLKSKLIP